MNAKYVITGTDYHGKRFSPIRTNNLSYAMSHNVYNGTLWEIVSGKRKRIFTWYN